jgi:hypothetical protein
MKSFRRIPLLVALCVLFSMILPSSVLVSATITADPVVVLVDETEYKRIGSSTIFITLTSEGYYAPYLLSGSDEIPIIYPVGENSGDYFDYVGNDEIIFMNDLLQDMDTSGTVSGASDDGVNFSNYELESFYIDETGDSPRIVQVRTAYDDDSNAVAEYTVALSIVNATTEGATMLVEMTMENLTEETLNMGVNGYWDTFVNGNDACDIIVNDKGWTAVDETYQVTASFRNAPFVTDASAIWYGDIFQDDERISWADVEAQAAGDPLISVSDSATAFFFNGTDVEPGDSLTYRVTLGMGPENAAPVLVTTNLAGDVASSDFSAGDALALTGTVEDTDEVGNEADVFVQLDEEAPVQLGSVDLSEGSDDFAGDFVLPADLNVGSHTLRIWATDSTGASTDADTAIFTTSASGSSPTPTENPITGDSRSALPLVGLALVGAAIAMLLRRRSGSDPT